MSDFDISKFKFTSSTLLPTVSFLEGIAPVLGISTDDIINTDLDNLNIQSKDLFKFVFKIIGHGYNQETNELGRYGKQFYNLLSKISGIPENEILDTEIDILIQLIFKIFVGVMVKLKSGFLAISPDMIPQDMINGLQSTETEKTKINTQDTPIISTIS